MTPAVLASSTSHKKEPLLPTLDVFARLGLRDLDLNLHHLLEEGVPVDEVADAVGANAQRIWVVSGGWCDFFHGAPAIEATWASIERQVGIARRLNVATLRLFFGRLARDAYGPNYKALVALKDRYDPTNFFRMNHNIKPTTGHSG